MATFSPFFVRWEYSAYSGNRQVKRAAFGRVIAIGYQPTTFDLLVEADSGALTRIHYSQVEVLSESDYRRLASAQIRRNTKKRGAK